MYSSTIVVDRDATSLEKLFRPEDKSLNRATYNVEKSGEKLTFYIKADDATALKTAFSTITKVFLVWEKSGGIASGK